MKAPKKGRTARMSEHNLPTEPVPVETVSPFLPTVDATLFPPELDLQPVTRMPSGTRYPALSSPVSKAYPYVAPTAQVVVAKSRSGSAVVAAQRGSGSQRKRRRSLVALFVGLCFVGVQMILLARFFVLILQPVPGLWGMETFYTVSALLVLPFRILWQQLSLPLSSPVEIYTLLAILAYGILSRLIVRLLKILLKAR